jgi:hypothetical protein
MSWTDYWEKFGRLYTEEEITAIKAAIKKAAAEDRRPEHVREGMGNH